MKWFKRFRAKRLRKAAAIAGARAFLAMRHGRYAEVTAHLRRAAEYERKADRLSQEALAT